MRKALLAACLLAVAGACSAPREAPSSGDAGAPDAGRVPVSEAAPDTGSDPMIVALEEAFAARNPRASRVSIVEFRREARGGGANLVLARGVKPDEVYEGRPEDELYGVFVFDDSLRRIRETVAMFPTPRWKDARLRFDRTSAESVFVLGWAATSGETLLTGGYPWGGGR